MAARLARARPGADTKYRSPAGARRGGRCGPSPRRHSPPPLSGLRSGMGNSRRAPTTGKAARNATRGRRSNPPWSSSARWRRAMPSSTTWSTPCARSTPSVVVGTSGVVLPADRLFGHSPAHSILINLEPGSAMNEAAFTERSYGPATVQLPELAPAIRARMG